ncbi:MAG TPA: hypothetical protein PLU39_02585 [Armatimonadota bacterium]|nr:hypothetical protein [Armatimonadota bacterium]HOM81236.1 hypothetical protein [Armatimonadota bacterium]HPO73599.1 hypothetical protein [Armatimonadota bacterium]HPT96735.1 hypothetical protein [Armatimonadota bacterium]
MRQGELIWYCCAVAGLGLMLAGCGSVDGDHTKLTPDPSGAPTVAVQPGSGLAGVTLSASYKAATDVLGQPTSTEPRQTDGPPAVLATWSDKGVAALFFDANDDGQVADTEQNVMLLATAPFAGSTVDGIAIGSPQAAVHAAYGTPDETTRGSTEWYLKRGLVIGYDAEKKVESFGIFTPQLENRTESEIIPGRSVGSVFLGGAYGAAESRYGTPAKVVPYQDQDQAVVFAYWPTRGILACYDDADKNGVLASSERCVLAYAALPFGGRTAEGVGTDATKAIVRSTYPPDAEAEGDYEEELLDNGGSADWYWRRGLVFNYNAQGGVTSIGVFTPLQAGEIGLGREIVPGKGVGPALIGRTYAELCAVLDLPEESSFKVQPVGDGQGVLAIWPLYRISVMFKDANANGRPDADEVAHMVWARTPYAGHTPEGIGTDADRARVRSAFGTPEETAGAMDWYWSRGIMFTYAEDGKVLSIGVFEPVTRAVAGLRRAASVSAEQPASQSSQAINRAIGTKMPLGFNLKGLFRAP